MLAALAAHPDRVHDAPAPERRQGHRRAARRDAEARLDVRLGQRLARQIQQAERAPIVRVKPQNSAMRPQASVARRVLRRARRHSLTPGGPLRGATRCRHRRDALFWPEAVEMVRLPAISIPSLPQPILAQLRIALPDPLFRPPTTPGNPITRFGRHPFAAGRRHAITCRRATESFIVALIETVA